MRYIDLLPKMDASVARVSRDFSCPKCYDSAFAYPGVDEPKLVGWCDTQWGYMMIVECPHCFKKYRFHATANKTDLAGFESAVRGFIVTDFFSNSEELKQKFNEKMESSLSNIFQAKDTLHLVLKKKWYDMITSGEKTEEYRAVTNYWATRLLAIPERDEDGVLNAHCRFGIERNAPKFTTDYWKMRLDLGELIRVPYDEVAFHLGYAKDRPTAVFALDGLSIGPGKPEWGAEEGVEYFILKIGKRIN